MVSLKWVAVPQMTVVMGFRVWAYRCPEAVAVFVENVHKKTTTLKQSAYFQLLCPLLFDAPPLDLTVIWPSLPSAVF